MRTLTELRAHLSNPTKALSLLASELQLLIQAQEWSFVWRAFVFEEFQNINFDILMHLQKCIIFPELDIAKSLRRPLTSNILDVPPGRAIWKNIIIPRLRVIDQINLSQTNTYFFKLLLELFELRDEFPTYYLALRDSSTLIDIRQTLPILRATAYPETEIQHRTIFAGIAKYYSALEFSCLISAEASEKCLQQERLSESSFPIESFSPFSLSIKLDRLPLLLLFLSYSENSGFEQLDNILKLSSQYGATTIIQFFLWAFPNDDYLNFGSYIPIACHYGQIRAIRLLAPRTHITILTMCLMTANKYTAAEKIKTCLQQFGVTVTEQIIDWRSDSPCYSNLMKDIIEADNPHSLALFLKIWPKTGISSVFYTICSKRNRGSNFPLDLIAFLFAHRAKIQLWRNPQKTFSRFLREISNTDQLKPFLNLYLPKWHAIVLDITKSKLIKEVCRAGHVGNFRALLECGVDINATFTSKKHGLSSPLSHAVFSPSTFPYFFDFLIENGAAFSLIAACQAIERGHLSALMSLFRLPNITIPNDSLEYHPLFVAAQFGRLDCYDFLISRGIAPDNLPKNQLWDFLVQGPIAGLLELNKHSIGFWLGPLYRMRSRILKKMLRAEIGNKFGFAEADPFQFPRFLIEKSELYLRIISMILPLLKDKIKAHQNILSIAVSTGNITLVLLVLAYSPALDARDHNEHCSLYTAIKQNNCALVSILLEHGVTLRLEKEPISLIYAAEDNPAILALLINSVEYAILGFPELPNKSRCLACLPYLTENSNNPIHPQLAEILYERYRLHPYMIPLEAILKKIEEITLGNGWGEQGFSRIFINDRPHSVPGIIAEICHLIVDFYKLPHKDAIAKLSSLFESIQNQIIGIKGFRLRFNSTITFMVCQQILKLIPDPITQSCKNVASPSIKY